MHLDHARAFDRLLADDAVVGLDLGTGVGLPGLALAGLRPGMYWTLLDAARRRLAVVTRAVEALGWSDRVTVVHARAEDHGRARREEFDVVVSRSFGRPAVAAECAAPLVRVGGQVLVAEPPEAHEDERWPVTGLDELGLEAGGRSHDPAIQELCKVRPTDERFPRRAGVADKRPLW